jgi:D-sedoheptulose 7-phosphate isomerase
MPLDFEGLPRGKPSSLTPLPFFGHIYCESIRHPEELPTRILLTDHLGWFMIPGMNQWIADYIKSQKAAHDSIPVDAVAQIIEKLRAALKEGRHVFAFGNGGSAANSSHFATDLGKGASDKTGKRFRVLSLTDNVSWMTALGNDYSYEDIFVGQLQNYGERGDIALGISVSGNSPNCVKALEWAKKNGLRTIALVGAKRGRMAEIAEQVIVINDTHYGRVEDAQMGICHMLCYAFMEHPEWAK